MNDQSTHKHDSDAWIRDTGGTRALDASPIRRVIEGIDRIRDSCRVLTRSPLVSVTFCLAKMATKIEESIEHGKVRPCGE